MNKRVAMIAGIPPKPKHKTIKIVINIGVRIVTVSSSFHTIIVAYKFNLYKVLILQ